MEAAQAMRLFATMKFEQIPKNQALILCYLFNNEGAEQIVMGKEINMGASVLSPNITILIAKHLIRQDTATLSGNRKQHYLTTSGKELIKRLLA